MIGHAGAKARRPGTRVFIAMMLVLPDDHQLRRTLTYLPQDRRYRFPAGDVDYQVGLGAHRLMQCIAVLLRDPPLLLCSLCDLGLRVLAQSHSVREWRVIGSYQMARA